MIALVELRRYRLRPGRRDELVALFERALVEPQEAAGLQVLGQFRDLAAPDEFVWLRGFAGADADDRARALARFYGGPVWREHGAAANATMLDSDDVLLLRPAAAATALTAGGAPRPPAGAPVAGRGGLLVTTALLDAPLDPPALDAAVAALRAAAAPLAVLVTAAVANAFPALPVRDEPALVWIEATPDPATAPPAAVPAPVAARLRGAPHVARLVPTARSLLPAQPPASARASAAVRATRQ